MARPAALVTAALAAGLLASEGVGALKREVSAFAEKHPCVHPQGVVAPSPLSWTTAGAGLAWARFETRAGRVPLVISVVQLDPRKVRLALDANVAADGRVSPWSLEAAPDDALLALNAGQFTDNGPWGWVAHSGREHLPPGSGPLSMAMVVDSTGAVTLVPAEEIQAWRESGRAVEAMQSYPALLTGEGELPPQLRTPAGGVDLDHRDTRLAVGVKVDGTVLFALTRVDGPGILANTPLGPTIVEMAELMQSLGAVRAMMLDGGLSAQMLLREGITERRWEGMRKVPLGIVAR